MTTVGKEINELKKTGAQTKVAQDIMKERSIMEAPKRMVPAAYWAVATLVPPGWAHGMFHGSNPHNHGRQTQDFEGCGIWSLARTSFV